MTDMHILLVDDEPAIRSVLRGIAEQAGAVVEEAVNGAQALAAVVHHGPTLVILDLGLPDEDGVDICRQIRAQSPVPVLVLSARDSHDEKVRALDAGADDYLTKPFSPLELMARIRAHHRRARMPLSTGADAVVVRGSVRIDVRRRTVSRRDEPVHLTRTEWALLQVLVAHAGRPVTHQQLFEQVWDRGYGDGRRYLRVYVGHLRRKLEEDPLRPRLILTEGGVGYRFTDAD